ncbi:MAG: serine/threonine-protein kinase, partial [Myxococcaceae bacterium]
MLGGFEVLRKLSDGASAEMFLARHEQAKGHVIVEVIRPELFRDPELTLRFLDAAKARKELLHPNVARLVAEGTADDGRPYLVTETVGGSFKELLQTRGPLDVENAIKMAIPLCDALQYLHQRGLVHGNINSSTVYVGLEGSTSRPKLIDYGLALLRPGRTLPRPPGRVLVPPEYLSPERVRGQRATTASDIYAMGVLLYEALTGAPPFTADDSLVVRRLHLEAPPPPLPETCNVLADVMKHCLAKAPADRYPNVFALRDALAARLEGTLPLPPQTVSLGAPDSDVPPGTGDQVGRYTLLEPVGEGAMGRVFLARHTRLGRTVALKLLKPEHSQNRDQVERFVREARAVNRIRNEHIVEIFDLVDEPVGQHGRRVYCVMELLKGRTLGELMLRGPVPLVRGLDIMRQVASALDAAHRAGVVHRDIKPDNIFISEKAGADFVKVVDFGVAKLRGAADPASAPAAAKERVEGGPGETAAGVLVGTPAYMSPEQIVGRDVDPRLDIYACGVVLYRLLCGSLPFEAPDFEVLLQRILDEAPKPLPSKTRSEEPIPPELAALVDACLAKSPDARPASMSELRAALDRIVEKLRPRRRSRSWSWRRAG